MEIYLVQHGLAASKDEDPDRPLTPEGEGECERVAAAVAGAGVRPDRILHSGKTRARQTAEIFARALGGIEIDESDGLAPLDDPTAIAGGLAGDERIALVGHLPHLSRLAALLVTGDPETGIVQFRNGGVIALRRTEGGWRVAWVVTPEVAPSR